MSKPMMQKNANQTTATLRQNAKSTPVPLGSKYQPLLTLCLPGKDHGTFRTALSA
jgi:hypothetical protein